MKKNNVNKQNTIRLLRRKVRRLKREIKSKDRLIFAQEEFYKCMLDEVRKREQKAGWTVRTLKNGLLKC